MRIAQGICEDARKALGDDDVVAIGVYGSLARGDDGPFSDVELLLVLRREPRKGESRMWLENGVLAEVDAWQRDALLRSARSVTDRWPLCHGVSLPLFDPTGFFAELDSAKNAPGNDGEFKQAVEECLLGELCETAGKARNAAATKRRTGVIPELAVCMVYWTSMVLGLHHRKTFATLATVVTEALALPQRPDGFDMLAQKTLSGTLDDLDDVAASIERLWCGALRWATEHGYHLQDKSPFAPPQQQQLCSS